MRAEHHIHIRRARNDVFAFLRGDTAAHTDQQIRVFLFQLADTTEVGEDFFLRFFADGAGVQQDDVGGGHVVGFFETALLAQDVVDFVGVVFIHLTAEGFDKYFFHEVLSSKQWFILGTLKGCFFLMESNGLIYLRKFHKKTRDYTRVSIAAIGQWCRV